MAIAQKLQLLRNCCPQLQALTNNSIEIIANNGLCQQQLLLMTATIAHNNYCPLLYLLPPMTTARAYDCCLQLQSLPIIATIAHDKNRC